jgi:hypothetical protein
MMTGSAQRRALQTFVSISQFYTEELFGCVACWPARSTSFQFNLTSAPCPTEPCWPLLGLILRSRTIGYTLEIIIHDKYIGSHAVDIIHRVLLRLFSHWPPGAAKLLEAPEMQCASVRANEAGSNCRDNMCCSLDTKLVSVEPSRWDVS